MVYITIMACVVAVCLTVVIVSVLVVQLLEGIKATNYDSLMSILHEVNDYKEIEKATLLEAIQAVTWGPQQTPTTLEEFYKKLEEEYTKEDVQEDKDFPLHELLDEGLRWVPNEEQELSLLDLPEHEENDQFMNTGVTDAHN